MIVTKCILAIAFCGLYTSVYAYPFPEELVLSNTDTALRLLDADNLVEGDSPSVLLVRHARSPSSSSEESSQGGRGRVEMKYEKTEHGREASIKYNHNLLKSDDDSYSVDAYAQARRNYDWNQNDFQGGLEGRWNF